MFPLASSQQPGNKNPTCRGFRQVGWKGNRYDPSGPLSVSPEAAHDPHQEQHEPADHSGRKHRSLSDHPPDGTRRAQLHGPQIQRAAEEARLGPGSHSRNRLSPHSHVYGQARESECLMKLVHRSRLGAEGKGPRLHKSTASPQARKIDHKAVPITLDRNFLSIYREL